MADAKAKGVKCYIGSAAPRINAEMIWNEANLADKLEGYICGDDVTNCKPHPEIFLRACDALGLKPEECVVFEDALSGLKAGFNAGCNVVALSTTAAAEDLTPSGVKHIFPSFEGLTIERLEELFG